MTTRVRMRKALAEIVWAMRKGSWDAQDIMYVRGARMGVTLMALGYEHYAQDSDSCTFKQIERIIKIKHRAER